MATTTKISRSKANMVWVTVRSVAFRDIVSRELFSDVVTARQAAKTMINEVEQKAAAEQDKLNSYAAPKV